MWGAQPLTDTLPSWVHLLTLQVMRGGEGGRGGLLTLQVMCVWRGGFVRTTASNVCLGGGAGWDEGTTHAFHMLLTLPNQEGSTYGVLYLQPDHRRTPF